MWFLLHKKPLLPHEVARNVTGPHSAPASASRSSAHNAPSRRVFLHLILRQPDRAGAARARFPRVTHSAARAPARASADRRRQVPASPPRAPGQSAGAGRTVGEETNGSLPFPECGQRNRHGDGGHDLGIRREGSVQGPVGGT